MNDESKILVANILKSVIYNLSKDERDEVTVIFGSDKEIRCTSECIIIHYLPGITRSRTPYTFIGKVDELLEINWWSNRLVRELMEWVDDIKQRRI